ncbi:TolC family protein [Maribacter algarum]|uniref:TolC family protein n=1 Tax=Maribacter algarum (ex Zhang et al. 2020) TaxID=2578118 RepID=A0A5S3QHR6_9FLAO|nr:TolC family protein [Maribacter algarum]TMM57075.1 TolC family protein [Maribacter algarum]
MRKQFILLLFLLGTAISFAQRSKTVTIGILADEASVENAPLLEKLQNEITAVVGQDAKVVFKDPVENNFDLDTAKANYLALEASDVDIILAFGVINNIALYQQKTYAKPVIVFGSVNSDFIDLPEDQKTSGINNIAYIIAPLSYSKDLDAFNSLYEYKKVGILVDDYLPEALPIKELFDTYFADKDATYTLINLPENGDISNVIGDIDAVYLAGGFALSDAALKTLISTINENQLPSFSANRKQDVEKGILATNQPESNIDQFFRRLALDVESIVNGTNPSELPMLLEYKNRLSLNFNTAKEIKFPLRYSMLGTVDIVGGENNFISENAYSLLDIMNGVIGRNLGLEAERKNIDLSSQDVKTAKSNFLPDVSASATGVYLDPRVAEISGGANPEFSTSGTVGLNQLIYSEGAAAGITIQENLQKAQQETYNAAELDAVLNGSVAYFNALILKTNAQIQAQNLEVTKKNLEISEQNFEAGAAGKSDVLRFRSQLAQNMQTLIEAGNQLNQAYFTVNQLMNNPIDTEIDVEDAIISEGLFSNYKYQDFYDILDNPKLRPNLVDFLIEEAKNNAPELKNIGYNLAATQRNYRLNSAGRFVPTVALQGQYNLALSQSGAGSTPTAGIPVAPDGVYNFGLNVSLPIFNQNLRNINKQTAKIQEDQLNIQKSNIDLNIETNINALVLDLTNEIANIQISKIAEEAAKESLDLTQNAYSQGAVPLIQLIDAQTNYLQSQIASANANYNYLLASMQLERAIGYFFLLNSEDTNQAFIQRAQAFILSRN